MGGARHRVVMNVEEAEILMENYVAQLDDILSEVCCTLGLP